MYCAIPDGSGYCSTAVPWEGTSCGNQKVGLKKWTTQDLDVCKWPSFFYNYFILYSGVSAVSASPTPAQQRFRTAVYLETPQELLPMAWSVRRLYLPPHDCAINLIILGSAVGLVLLPTSRTFQVK